MRKILNKYIFLMACFFVGFGVLADPPPSGPGLPVDTPPGEDCCLDLEPEFGEGPSDEYLACLDNPAGYCTVPIDNSIYIYALMGTGFVFASLVIIRKIKNKKTPM